MFNTKRNFAFPGRSTAYGEKAMAATSSPQATLTAVEILRRGGNAMDAAIAAAAVLCVTEPHMTGLGGDGFAIVAESDGTIHGLNGSGRSAAAATGDWLKAQNLKSIDAHSIHAVTTPGLVDCWLTLLANHGTMPLDDVLKPAIRFAENGVPTLPRVAEDWAELAPLLAKDEGAAQHYLNAGKAPSAGDVMRYPALAQTLKRIVCEGRDGFYHGPVADDIIATLKSRGSLITHDDLAQNYANTVKPIRTTYASHQVWEIPPSGQGLTVLIALNILKIFGLRHYEPDSPQRRHLEIEALKRAWLFRNRHIADPDFAEVPVAEFLSEQVAQKLAGTIDTRRASTLSITWAPSDTVYLTVVDENRLCVSLINSIFHGFGSGIVAPKSGVTLQNRGAGFVTDPSHPNVIGPAKRPLHTIIPSLTTRRGKPDMVFGVMGGDFQPMGHVNMVVNRYNYGMGPQEALDLPRVAPDGLEVAVEASVSQAIRKDLTAMGHVLHDAHQPLGGGQIIALDHARGVLIGGSDPRKDGFALGF